MGRSRKAGGKMEPTLDSRQQDSRRQMAGDDQQGVDTVLVSAVWEKKTKVSLPKS